MAVFGGADGRAFQKGVTLGSPEGTAILQTDHAALESRTRVRWDFESSTTAEGTSGCSTTIPCLNVVARSFPTASGLAGIVRTDPAANWEGAGLGLGRIGRALQGVSA
jgi:hypothetical protein